MSNSGAWLNHSRIIHLRSWSQSGSHWKKGVRFTCLECNTVHFKQSGSRFYWLLQHCFWATHCARCSMLSPLRSRWPPAACLIACFLLHLFGREFRHLFIDNFCIPWFACFICNYKRKCNYNFWFAFIPWFLVLARFSFGFFIVLLLLLLFMIVFYFLFGFSCFVRSSCCVLFFAAAAPDLLKSE